MLAVFSPPQHALESVLSLQSFFAPLLPQLLSSTPSKTSYESNPEPEFIYRTWLRSMFDNFVQYLSDVAVSSKSEDAIREVVLDTIMGFVKVGNAGKFHSAIYHKLLHAIVSLKDIPPLAVLSTFLLFLFEAYHSNNVDIS